MVNAKQVKVCPGCEEVIGPDDSELETRFRCEDCAELHEEKSEATACCKE